MIMFNETRSYGVEIKLAWRDGISLDILLGVLTRQNIDAKIVETPDRVPQAYWKISNDASCGYEIVSPILLGQEGFEQIRAVCYGLNTLGGGLLDRRCSLHVHHYGFDLELKNLKYLLMMYVKYERDIDNVMQPQCWQDCNPYAQSMLKPDYLTTLQVMRRIRDCKSLSELMECYPGQYWKVSINSLLRHQTVEFRQHYGTTNFRDIEAWIMLTQAMLEKSLISKTILQESKYRGIATLLNFLQISRKEGCSKDIFAIGAYFRNRERVFRYKYSLPSVRYSFDLV